jgi:hypothetical protein
MNTHINIHPITSLPWEQETLVWVAIMSALCATAFPVLYGIRSPWYDSVLGRVVMSYSTSLALALDYTLYQTFALLYHWPMNYWWNIWIEICLFALIGIAALAKTLVLAFFQRQGRMNRALVKAKTREQNILHPQDD